MERSPAEGLPTEAGGLAPSAYRARDTPFVHASLATAALRSETRRFISSLAGRISNVVILILTAGCFDISAMAWFRSRASSSRMPPSVSLVSTIRTIGDLDLAILHPQRDCVTGGIERFSPQEMPASPKYIVVGKAFLHHSLRVCLRNLSKRRLVEEP